MTLYEANIYGNFINLLKKEILLKLKRKIRFKAPFNGGKNALLIYLRRNIQKPFFVIIVID